MSTPVVPVMVPPVSLTAPTVSEKVERRSSPPFTVTGAAFARWLLAAKTSAPASTVVPPRYE